MAAQQQQPHPSEVLFGQSLSARFTIGDYVAGGSFGSFHYGVEEKTGERVINLEKRDAPQPQIHLEYDFYRRLDNARFIPKVRYIGMCPEGEWHALMLDLPFCQTNHPSSAMYQSDSFNCFQILAQVLSET